MQGDISAREQEDEGDTAGDLVCEGAGAIGALELRGNQAVLDGTLEVAVAEILRSPAARTLAQGAVPECAVAVRAEAHAFTLRPPARAREVAR